MTPRVLSTGILYIALWLGCGCNADSGQDDKRTVDAASEPIRAAVKSNASVSAKLATAMRDQKGNLFYSPISIEAVTGMLFAGAAGNTAAQLGTLLDAEDDPTSLHEGLGALLADFDRAHSSYTLSLANRLWATPGLRSSQAFIETTRDLYNAPMEQGDFARNPDGVRKDINRWVAAQTADKIPELFNDGQITSDTVMAVVNAIYFKADWAHAFDAKLTRPDTFHLADSTTVPVQMMTTPSSELRTSFDGVARWVELPYRGGDIAFLLYTQAAQQITVQELQASLDGVELEQVVAKLQGGETVVQMPRFSLRSRIDLVPVFNALGITDLFDPVQADLTNIDADGGAYVGPFIHEAMVQVDETGTVAAAATGAGTLVRSSAPLPVRFDHPFLFFIRDNLTGAILFSGQVADPSKD